MIQFQMYEFLTIVFDEYIYSENVHYIYTEKDQRSI